MVKTQIFKGRDKSRDTLLEWVITRTSKSKLKFDMSYYLVFQNVRCILQELQILLAPNKEHRKVFLEFLMWDFMMVEALQTN